MPGSCWMGRTTVDGNGAQRVIESLKDKDGTCELRLKPVTQEDCHLLWGGTNDPVTRAASFASDFIPWDEHVKWFQAKLSDPTCYHYIFLAEDDTPVGQVRFDTSGDEAQINISVAPIFRGHDFATKGIRIASERLFQETAVTRIYAYIKRDNVASIRAFTKAGYEDVGVKEVKGHKALQMVLKKNGDVFAR